MFDYTELQIMVRSITNSSFSGPNLALVNKTVQHSFENSKCCQEIMDVINERLKSKKSSLENIMNVFLYILVIHHMFCRL